MAGAVSALAWGHPRVLRDPEASHSLALSSMPSVCGEPSPRQLPVLPATGDSWGGEFLPL